MQDNPFDEKFMDEAWSLMNQQLNEAMPQERKRRFVFWWWLLPSLGAAALFLLLFLPLSTSTNQPIDAINQAQQVETPIAQIESVPSSVNPELKNQEIDPPISTSIENKPTPLKRANPTNLISQQKQTSSESPDLRTNNPIIPNEQDPVTEPAFQDPKASVLHTAAEVSTSDQRIAPAAPVTDLRFFSPFEPLNLPANLVQTKLDLENLELKGFQPKVSKLYNRRATAAAFVSAGYYGPHDQMDFALGLGWKQQRGRFFLRLEPGVHFGSTSLSAPSNRSLDNSSVFDQMNSGTSLEPSFDPNSEALASGAQEAINAQFTALTIPLTIGYQFKEKWSLEAGAQWGLALNLRALDPLTESTVNRFNNLYNTNGTNADLDKLFQPEPWIEGRVGLNYRWSNRVELQASYRFGQANFSNTSRWAWHRDLIALQLRYRLR